MLDPTLFERYDKMFEKMIDDMERLDKSQFENYGGLFEKNLLEQFKKFEGYKRSYKWTENKSERVLEFRGKLIENDQVKIEIKESFIHISASFSKKNTTNHSKSKSIRYLSKKIPVPKDCDESSVRFDNKGEDFRMVFKKFKKPGKKKFQGPLRSPLKKQIGAPTI